MLLILSSPASSCSRQKKLWILSKSSSYPTWSPSNQTRGWKEENCGDKRILYYRYLTIFSLDISTWWWQHSLSKLKSFNTNWCGQ